MEEFPPFTVVNGKVWPVLEVQPATYRLRVLKRVERRTYRPVLMRDGRPELDRIPQIGTDHGLLRSAVALRGDGLVLAYAERGYLIGWRHRGPSPHRHGQFRARPRRRPRPRHRR